jgi:hypothetical protein
VWPEGPPESGRDRGRSGQLIFQEAGEEKEDREKRRTRSPFMLREGTQKSEKVWVEKGVVATV